MASNLKLQPNPTFEIIANIPVAGALEHESVVFTVKHLPHSKLDEVTGEGIAYADFAQTVAVDWDIDAPFSADNLAILFDNYPAAARAIYEAYGKEFFKVVEKN